MRPAVSVSPISDSDFCHLCATVGPISEIEREIELKTGHRISVRRFLRLEPLLYVFRLVTRKGSSDRWLRSRFLGT